MPTFHQFLILVLLSLPFISLAYIYYSLNKSLDRREHDNKYRYGYIRHPFDDENFFTIHADSQEEANQKATTRLEELAAAGEFIGVLPQCWPKKK